MTTPVSEGLITVPYVGVSEFRTSPTWLDTDDLVIGGTQQAQQDAELYNVLLRASGWAERYCRQPLRAHLVVDQLRCRVDRWGRAKIHPTNHPVRSVVGLAFGPDPTNMQPLATVNSSTVWVEDQRGLVVSLLPINASYLGTLQFGSIPPAGGEIFVQLEYVAGYCNTYLTQSALQGATQLTLADPTGLVPPSTSLLGTSYGASVMRIWDPGVEEAVSVASSYVIGADPVILAAGTQNAHTAGCQVSEIPPEVRQAVICYSVGLLLREDASADNPYPGSPGPTARRSGKRGKAGGLITEAERLLLPFRRVR